MQNIAKYILAQPKLNKAIQQEFYSIARGTIVTLNALEKHE